MSDSFGSILQSSPRVKILSNVNLLIATNNTAELEKIIEPLHAAQITFTCDRLSVDELSNNLPQKQYSAILYVNSRIGDCNLACSLAKTLQVLYVNYPQVPLILLTDPLGDEQAVALMQSGLSAYVLKRNLCQLPEILQQTWLDFSNKRFLPTKEQSLIQQQQQTIHQLKIEKQSWLAKEQLQQEHIAHLNHELRGPISSMLGFAGMLKGQYYGALNDKQMQYVSALLGVGEHMLALVKNYLDLIKIDAHQQTLDLEKPAVEEICQASLNIVEEKAQQKQLKLIFNLEKNIDFCTADSTRLKQILVNLLANAIKFTDRGSVTLDVKLRKNWLYFAVTDTGTGIAPQNIKKLFSPFPQISNHHENTGLGLALSQKIAQLHGGEITVTSKLGVGSCFTLNIPQHQ